MLPMWMKKARANGNALSETVKEQAAKEGAAFVVISAKIESELSGLEAEERDEFLNELGP